MESLPYPLPFPLPPFHPLPFFSPPVQTVRFKTELERNITIKLGYANAKIFKCDNNKCARPDNYKSFKSSMNDMKPKCEKCGSTMTLQRHVSFVDCFGLNTAFAKPDGSVILNKDITVGEKLLGPDGRMRTVLAVKEGQKELYEIAYGSESFTCTGGHLLCLRIETPIEAPVFDAATNTHIVRVTQGDQNGIQTLKAVFQTEAEARAFYSQAEKTPVEFEITVESFLQAPETIRSMARLYTAKPMDFVQNENVILRTSSSSSSSLCDENVAHAVGAYLASSSLSTSSSSSSSSLLTDKLAALGLTEDAPAHVPLAIIRGSRSVRKAFLAGLTSSSSSSSSSSISQSPQSLTLQLAGAQLAAHTAWILRSLGHVTNVTEVDADLYSFNVLSQEASSSASFEVRSAGVGPFRGFEVDGDGCMLLANFVVAHNCPGHDILMATMLNGAAVMDAALLLIAGNEPCPQPQTSEHLAAVEIMKLKNIIILQNKIDLVKEKDAASQYEEILNFVRGTVADGAPIIPISAQLKYNIEIICEYICTKIPKPVRDFTSSPRLIIIRSFDVNHPGAEVHSLVGGVAGGSILRGVLRKGQEIEVRPGIVTRDREGHVQCIPMFSKIVSLFAEKNNLAYAVPGGLIGVGTKIDPTLTRADRLVGQVLGEVGQLPDIFTELEISFFLLRRLLGVKTDASQKKADKITKLARGEMLMVNIGSTSTGARVINVRGDLAKVALTSPVCSSEGEKLALSRRVDKHWRLIGWGMIRRGTRINEETTGDEISGGPAGGDDATEEADA